MEQDPKELRSKLDEKNYLKNMEIAEKKNMQKDHEQKFKKEKDQINNYRSLAMQLQERQMQQQNNKLQERAIGQYYNKEADKYRQEMEDEKMRKKRQKEEYYKALSNQINENKKKKQYSVLMSEHERRVNDKDIKAYEYQDTSNLYAKVPGFSGDDRLDKYIDKSMSVPGNRSVHNSPARAAGKGNALDTSSEHGSNLARMGQMSLNRSANILADGQEAETRPAGDSSYNPTKLQRVRENMERPDAIKYRANTNNRGYGFEQSIHKSPPATKIINKVDEVNPYEYNFVAPGNY
jgi:hypothetical protein